MHNQIYVYRMQTTNNHQFSISISILYIRCLLTAHCSLITAHCSLLLAMLWVVSVWDHTDGVITPLLQHGVNICELVTSNVVLHDGIVMVIITIPATWKYYDPVIIFLFGMSLPKMNTRPSMLVALNWINGFGRLVPTVQLPTLGLYTSVESRL